MSGEAKVSLTWNSLEHIHSLTAETVPGHQVLHHKGLRMIAPLSLYFLFILFFDVLWVGQNVWDRKAGKERPDRIRTMPSI